MFLGHYGVALALKRAEPKVSLGTLFLATELLDLLWGAFILLGWEHARIGPGLTPVNPLEFTDYPISHSLLGALAWAVAGAVAYYSWPTRDTSRHWQASALVGVAVLSHWPLDLVVHLPDLTLAGAGTPALGLGLWRSIPGTLAVEFLTLLAGTVAYVTSRSHRHPLRPVRLGLVLIILVGTYLASLFGPPPPDLRTVAVSGIAFIVVLALLGAWADRPEVPTRGR